jgi:hypothetical protein
MCPDCQDIAEEYRTLAENRAQALFQAEQELDELKAELKREKKKASYYKNIVTG